MRNIGRYARFGCEIVSDPEQHLMSSFIRSYVNVHTGAIRTLRYLVDI